MLPCVLVPDLAGLDWPAARLPESIANRPSMSDDFLKAALPPSCSRTGRCVEQGVYPALRWSRFHPTTTPPLNARCRSDRFDWPAGGTEEFLGRWSARINSRRTEAKGVLADPLYVFGAVGRTRTPGVVRLDRDGNRNDRTSRCRHEGRALVTRGTTVQNRSSSSREFRGARLDFSVHIWVGQHFTREALASLPAPRLTNAHTTQGRSLASSCLSTWAITLLDRFERRATYDRLHAL